MRLSRNKCIRVLIPIDMIVPILTHMKYLCGCRECIMRMAEKSRKRDVPEF